MAECVKTLAIRLSLTIYKCSSFGRLRFGPEPSQYSNNPTLQIWKLGPKTHSSTTHDLGSSTYVLFAQVLFLPLWDLIYRGSPFNPNRCGSIHLALFLAIPLGFVCPVLKSW